MPANHAHLSTVEDVLRLLRGVEHHGTYWKARCPAHEDNENSLSISTGTKQALLMKCFAGCSYETIKAALEGGPPPPKDRRPTMTTASANKPRGEAIALYTYHNADGSTFATKRRYANKDFSWPLGTKNAPLYKLFAIHGREKIFFVEGEKDCDRLWAHGLPATCNPNGAGETWREEFTDQLLSAGVKEIAVLYDEDAPGRQHGHKVALACQQAGIVTKLVSLPDLAEGQKDVSDWLDAGNTKAQLSARVKWTTEYVPPTTASAESSPSATKSKPTITTNVHADWNDLLDTVFSELVAVNAPSPSLFQRGVHLVRVRVDEDGRPMIEPMTESSLKGLLAERLLWVRKDQRSLVPVQPPDAVIKNLLARSEWTGIPALRDIIQAPVFTRGGGIITETGYHAPSRLWYAPSSGLRVTVPASPTASDLDLARDLILNDLLGEFPFDGPASKSHAVAAILLPFVRELIDGPTPLHAYTAPTPGSGKGLLVELTSLIATGRPALPVSAPDQDEEMRKRITSQLRRGTPIIVLDNLNDKLESASLCAALTSEEWSDRILGVSEMTPSLPNRALWACTANNPEFSLDVARRTVVIRIDSGTECPWERTFRHADIKGWARAHRSELVSAALTLVQAWLSAGRPTTDHPPIGSFESWAAVMSGILGHAGVKGFLANYKDVYQEANSETGEWIDFVEAWYEKHASVPTLVKDLFDLARQRDMLLSVMGDGEERSQRTRLGNALSKHKDRMFAGLQIHFDGRSNKGLRYRLKARPV